MLPIGLNHMTVPRHSARGLIDVANAVGAVGVELRNDLGQPLFDGAAPDAFAAQIRQAGLRILALAEVKSFNDPTVDLEQSALALIETAAACGAEGVALIPQVGTEITQRKTQRETLRRALDILQPILEMHGVRGFIEPLGFANSTLRFKEDVVQVLGEMGGPTAFAIIHDTFHHHLSGEAAVYGDLTAVVHISGVGNASVAVQDMTDAHRGLVTHQDRLGNIAQLHDLIAQGYTGPMSFEAFAPSVQDLKDPAEALAGSIAFINSHLSAPAAGAA